MSKATGAIAKYGVDCVSLVIVLTRNTKLNAYYTKHSTNQTKATGAIAKYGVDCVSSFRLIISTKNN